ncbi:hypothetical protein [Nocardiopsis halotolerans]|uniref:hypothetical protein n=1 Tax=Nocardiopsis halotolerans TaxID=124252 RepID=UPI0003498FBE|nr:hypothetical protein [Nocardiopsis halotolerans]
MRPRRERRHTVTPVIRTRLVVATTVVSVVPCVLYPLVGLWTLLWIPAVLLLLGAFLVYTEGTEGAEAADASPERESGDPSRPPGALGEPVAGRGTRVRPVALPSATEDYDLVFSAVVHWRWDGHVDLRLRNPVAPAVLAVVTRASELARRVEPGGHGTAECELAARLAVETAVIGSGIVVWAEEVSLRLPEEDEERLRRMAGLRKDRQLREVERETGQDPMAAGPVVPPRPAADEDLDPFGDPLGFVEDDADMPPGPGSDVDGEGYESYWWPADNGTRESAERDVQVAILRGLIDSVRDEATRTRFAREQLIVLERGGFAEVAHRVRQEYPEVDGEIAPGSTGDSEAL